MNTGYDLLCPFLTDEPLFAHGVEFGLLFARMQSTEDDAISGYYCRFNQDQILLLASRQGWTVAKMEPWGDDWLWIELERKR